MNCLAAADRLLVTVHPGGFELRALVHLTETANILRQRINPKLELTGTVLTNCDNRKRITEVVRREIAARYRLFGMVRGDTALQYASGQGEMLTLKSSHALAEYAAVAEQLDEIVWQPAASKA